MSPRDMSAPVDGRREILRALKLIDWSIYFLIAGQGVEIGLLICILRRLH